MFVLLRNTENGTFYARDNSRILDKYHPFFKETKDINVATYFESVGHLEQHLEARLMFIPLNLKDKDSVKQLKNLLKESKKFEIVTKSFHSNRLRKCTHKLYNRLKDIIIYQALTHSYNNSFADFYMKLKEKKSLKKYIFSVHNLREEALKNLLGDDIEIGYDSNAYTQPIYVGTNRKEDINLIKICFENSYIVSVETKLLKSL